VMEGESKDYRNLLNATSRLPRGAGANEWQH
jgi:hypothetical protein